MLHWPLFTSLMLNLTGSLEAPPRRERAPAFQGRTKKLVPGWSQEEQGSSFLNSNSKAEILRGRRQDRAPGHRLCLPPSWKHQITPRRVGRGGRNQGPWTRVARTGDAWQCPACHPMPDCFVSHQPCSSMDLNHPVASSQLCCGAPCPGLLSHLHNMNNRPICNCL